MKKNYIAPNMEITKVTLQQMIAGSPVTTEGLDGNGGWGGESNGTQEPASRRRRNLWEDEEDDF